MRNFGRDQLAQISGFLLGLGRHQPTVDGDAQVLQQALVFGQLGLQGLERDAVLFRSVK